MKHYISHAMYLRLVRSLLFSFLVFLPFQYRVIGFAEKLSSKLPTIISNLDELIVIIFLLPSIAEYYRSRKVLDRSRLLLLLSPFFLFGICGMISAYINYNFLLISVLGIFDYLKNFLVIFIYAAFFRDLDDFKKIFRILFIIGLLLATFVVIKFLWAMGSVYIFNKAITDHSIYLFMKPDKEISGLNVWRSGIYRTSYYYYNGLYFLLLMTIYLFRTKKVNIFIISPLFVGMLSSVSRIVYGGLIFIMSAQLLKGRKWVIPLLIIILLIFIPNINVNNDLDLSMFSSKVKSENHINYNSSEYSVRSYSRYKSMEIWKDHPIWGVGPGMFGGTIASKYVPHIYDDYNVIRRTVIDHGVEQFWFQLLTEMGIVGILCFINLFVILYITLYKLRKQAKVEDLKNIYSALIAYIVCIMIYCFGTGINISLALFTYSAFVGMGLGIIPNLNNKKES